MAPPGKVTKKRSLPDPEKSKMTTPRAGKRDKPATDHTPPKESKKPRENDHEVCLICDAVIHEEDNAEDAVYCEGDCQGWLHRKCVCMSKKLYIATGQSNDPYFCPHCKFVVHQKEVDRLRDTIKALSNELALLKSKEKPTDYSANVDQIPVASHSGRQQLSSNVTSKSETKPTVETSSADRKFSIVLFGIDENPTGTSRHD